MVNLTDMALVVAQIVLGAAVGEAVCEFLFMPLVDWLAARLAEEPRTIIKRTWSAAVGIAIAINYSLDLFGLLGMAGRWGLFGVILTGALLGRGANWVHAFIEGWIAKAASRKAEAVMAVRSAMAFKERG